MQIRTKAKTAKSKRGKRTAAPRQAARRAAQAAEPLVAEPPVAEPLAAKPLVVEPDAVLHARRCGFLVRTARGWTHWDCQSDDQWHASDVEIEELIGSGRLTRIDETRVALAPATLPKAGRF